MNDPDLAQKIADAVEQRLGQRDAALAAIIAEEVAQALGQDPTLGSSALQDPAMVASIEGPTPLTERVVVSANGRNGTGIVAALTRVIGDFGGDIRDISQTIVGAYFTILIVVDIAHATGGKTLADLRDRLKEAGEKVGIHVVTLHDDLLAAMHNI